MMLCKVGNVLRENKHLGDYRRTAIESNFSANVAYDNVIRV